MFPTMGYFGRQNKKTTKNSLLIGRDLWFLGFPSPGGFLSLQYYYIVVSPEVVQPLQPLHLLYIAQSKQVTGV